MPNPKTVRSFRTSGMTKIVDIPMSKLSGSETASQGVPEDVNTTYSQRIDIGYNPDQKPSDLAAVAPINTEHRLRIPDKPTPLGNVDLGAVEGKVK